MVPRDNTIYSAPDGLEPALADELAVLTDGRLRAGALLRAARERLGWALPDVASMLRIRASYLGALEAGRLSYLPGKVYTLGFLRTYAAALGLNPEEMVREFQAETGITPRNLDLAFPAPVADRGWSAGAMILLSLLLLAGAYAGWYRLSGEGKLPAETVKPVPTRLATLAEQAIPGPDGRVHVPVAPTLHAAPSAEDNGLFEPRQAAPENPLLTPEPPPVPMREAVDSAPPMTLAPTTALAMPVRRDDALSSARIPPGPDSANDSRIELRFTGDTWVQVKERGGPALVSKVMKSGEIFQVPAKQNLVLNTGNAGHVEVLVDGVSVPSLGSMGTVRRDVPLDPDQLKAGTTTPPARR